jgi:hypothetical protein
MTVELRLAVTETREMSIEIDVTGNVTHTVSHSGKITYGSATKEGEVYFTFDPGDFESQKIRAENAIRLLDYAKWLYKNPENLPSQTVVVQSGGATAKVSPK